MHYGCSDLSQCDPAKIINAHRYTEASVKQGEEESYEQYRKNVSLLDNVQYFARPKSSSGNYVGSRNKDTESMYFTPTQLSFIRKGIESEGTNKCVKTISEANTENLNGSADIGKESDFHGPRQTTEPVEQSAKLDESDDIQISVPHEPEKEAPTTGRSKKRSASICTGCYNRSLIAAKEAHKRCEKIQELVERQQADKRFYEEVQLLSTIKYRVMLYTSRLRQIYWQSENVRNRP